MTIIFILKFITLVFIAMFTSTFFGAVAGLIVDLNRHAKAARNKVELSFYVDSSPIYVRIVALLLLSLFIAYVSTLFSIKGESPIYYFLGGFLFLEQCAAFFFQTYKKMKEEIMGSLTYSGQLKKENLIYTTSFIVYVLLCFASRETLELIPLLKAFYSFFEWAYEVPFIGVLLSFVAVFYVVILLLKIYVFAKRVETALWRRVKELIKRS